MHSQRQRRRCEGDDRLRVDVGCRRDITTIEPRVKTENGTKEHKIARRKIFLVER
jgi:hypothetical protein